jgi:hypothetical protein
MEGFSSEDPDYLRACLFLAYRIAALAEYQKGETFHPFTCPEPYHEESICLIPTTEGWICGAQTCTYTQPYGDIETDMMRLVPWCR